MSHYPQPSHDQYASNPQSTQSPVEPSYPPQSLQHPNEQTYRIQSPNQLQQPLPQYAYFKASSPPQNLQSHVQQHVSEQPLPLNPMVVKPGGNKNAKNMPYGPDQLRDWSTGMFDCLDDPDKCVLALFCPCVSYSQIKQRYGYLVEYGLPDPSRGGTPLNTNCILYGGMQLCLCGWLLQINMSSVVRQRYNIRGSAMKDVLSASCCIPCDLVRQSREIEFEEHSLGQHAFS